jgi:methyl-accepting chemotaxis protein
MFVGIGWFKNLGIAPKLVVAFIAVGILPLVISGVASLQNSRTALESEAFAKLAAIAEYKTRALESWVHDRMADVHAIPLTPFYVSSAKILLSDDPEAKAHAREEVLHEFKVNQKLHGYFNEMKLLDLDGNHLASLRGIDVNESAKKWFKTAIANSKKTVKGGKCHDLYVSTCEFCGELGIASVHMSHVIRDRETFEPIAMIVVDVNVDQIEELMAASVGLGETGQTYLVGPDGMARSNLRLEKEPTIFKKRIDTEGVKHVFEHREERRGAGICKNEIYEGYRGIPVLAHNHYLPELDLAIVTEVDETEAFAAADNLAMLIFLIAAGGFAIIGLVGFLLARSFSRPITGMTGAMERLAEGDLDIVVPAQGQKDEIGNMAGAVQVFKENAHKVRRMEQQRAADTRRNERKVQSELRALNNAMDEEVQGAVSAVVEKTDTMQASAQGMAATAEETNRQSTAVAAAAERASANVQTVAAAAEELSSSITEISRQVAQSSQIAGGAVRESEHTNQQIQGLAETVGRISEVVSMITDIADQTNLLALNATIEAARAGEAGKGFAVVASEVKNLANQTAKATDEIGSQIEGVQTATEGAVTAIESIGKTIGEIDEIASAIAAAVEEQGAATQEIARNVEQAAAGTREVSENISGVTQAAGETGQGATDQLTMATDVGDQVKQMQERLTQLTADSANPHLSERHTVNMAVKIAVDGAEEHCLLHDISRAGVAVLDRLAAIDPGTEFEMDVPGLGRLPGAVIARSGGSTHARFDLDDAQLKALDEFVSSAIAKRSPARSA